VTLRGVISSHAIKLAVSHVLYYTGLLQLWQAVSMRHKAVVLMYHRVLTADELRCTGSHPALVVDCETFARQIALLKRRFTVLSVQELAVRMERGIPFPSSSCVITFDDGWRDSFSNALPILKRHSLPALVFLPVNYIGSRRLFWPEALTHMLARVALEVRRHPERRARFQVVLAPAGLAEILDTAEDDLLRAAMEVVRTRRATDRPELEQLAEQLSEELGVSTADLSSVDGFMDWDQVHAMAQEGIAFGGHGAEHLLLTQVRDADVEREVRVSKGVLDEQLQEPVPAFSYPNGYFTPAVVEAVKAAGYRLAFITSRGRVGCNDDRFTIRRLNVHGSVTDSTPMFLARVVGLL
jgi:peptidoglycan/xylan/chitin deacetylase (PgdA/CDA1 family)